jgi:hypothetical protein
MKTIATKGYRTMRDAHAAADNMAGKWAVTLDGFNIVLDGADVARLERAGREFAYITLHNGQIMTVPVN